jgi:hypothetical protein
MQSQGTDPLAPPPPMPTAEQVQVVLDQRLAVQQLQLAHRVNRGANWLYWIAGLTAVNSLAALGELNFGFSLGLGLTMLIDATLGHASRVAAIGLDVAIVGVWIGLGLWAKRLSAIAFWLGIAFFAADALLCLYLQLYLSVLLHAWAIFAMWGGLQALNRFKRAG